MINTKFRIWGGAHKNIYGHVLLVDFTGGFIGVHYY